MSRNCISLHENSLRRTIRKTERSGLNTACRFIRISRAELRSCPYTYVHLISATFIPTRFSLVCYTIERETHLHRNCANGETERKILSEGPRNVITEKSSPDMKLGTTRLFDKFRRGEEYFFILPINTNPVE